MGLKHMIRCGLCAAWIAVCAWIWVPIGEIGITMQTFGVCFSLGFLGGKKGTAACGIYLLLGAVGLPVFSGYQGGAGVLLSPTGGYLWGFFLCSLIYWALEGYLPGWLCMTIGMLGCYLCGSLWFYFVYTHSGLWLVLLKCVLPYLLPDGIKIWLAALVSKRMRRKT